MPRRCLCALGFLSLALIVLTGTGRGESPAPLASLQFLLGQWEGVGDQAAATGGFTLAASVQDRVIVRTNHSNTPANSGRPASRHDDVMAIYRESGVVKADYFDSENHVIRYVAEARPGEMVFASEAKASEPTVSPELHPKFCDDAHRDLRDRSPWTTGRIQPVPDLGRAKGSVKYESRRTR
jgi:hypothetical protein